MVIGFLLDDTLDSTDGVQQYVINLGQWMTENGHEVHYFVGETSRQDISRVHSLSKNIKVRFNKNKLSIPLGASKSKIRKLLNEVKLDVVHVQLPCSPQLSGRFLSCLDDRVAVVGTFHVLPYSTGEKLGSKMLSLAIARVLKRIDYFISVSEPAKESAEQCYKVKSEVVPNLVRFPKLTEKSAKTNRKKILFVGRLVKRKGCMELLEAYRLAIAKYDLKADLAIAGTGYLLDEVSSYIKSNNLESHVELLGFVSEKEKYELLAGCDIAVYPSLGGESFGIVLIEAMASGSKVVLGGNNPGYSSVLKDERTLFDPKDSAKLAQLLNEFITNEDKIASVNKYQQKIVKNFDVNVVASKILNIYEEQVCKKNSIKQ